MKKHKSVVAILLAVMMIFAMMPAMAFATTTTHDSPNGKVTADWAEDYSSVVVNGSTFPAKRTWEDGMIHAEWDASSVSASAAVGLPDKVEAYYYDFTGAKLLVNGTVITKYARDEFNTVFPKKTGNTGSKIQLTVPTYVENYASIAKKTWDGNLTGWTVTVDQPAGFDDKATADQTFNVPAILEAAGEAKGTDNAPYIRGSYPIASITFAGKAQTAKDAMFYFDEVTKDGGFTASTATIYNGAEQKVVMNELPGYTVKYSVFNSSTGAYDAVDAPSVTNVGDKAQVKAVVSNGKQDTGNNENEKTYNFTVTVNPATAPSFAFIQSRPADKGDVYDYVVKEGTKYNPVDYVEVVEATTGSDAEKAASKKAVAANKDLLMAYFADFYGVDETPNKQDASYITLSMADYNTKATDEVKAKYAALLKNFGVEKFNATGTDKILKVVSQADWYEIEFVKSPTKKTYKAKVLKKKAKSFKVKAVATNGEAVNYKLINAPEKIVINKTTGKITLKKGLKKGTYKIVVKAYVPKSFGEGVNWPNETHKITIKVKK